MGRKPFTLIGPTLMSPARLGCGLRLFFLSVKEWPSLPRKVVASLQMALILLYLADYPKSNIFIKTLVLVSWLCGKVLSRPLQSQAGVACVSVN